jgi:hypothetical protein
MTVSASFAVGAVFLTDKGIAGIAGDRRSHTTQQTQAIALGNSHENLDLNDLRLDITSLNSGENLGFKMSQQ